MPTKEELGIQKPKKGPCENCGKRGGKLRRLQKGSSARFVLCSDCAREMGASHTLARRGRHHHGGSPGRLV